MVYRAGSSGVLDVEQLRSDWMGLVAGVQAARPRSNAMQSRRVLEDMLPFIRPSPTPSEPSAAPEACVAPTISHAPALAPLQAGG